MLNACAPGFVPRVTKHSIFIRYAGKMGVLPKGPGIPKGATVEALRGVEIELAKARKVAQNLGLSLECVHRHLPGLLRSKSSGLA